MFKFVPILLLLCHLSASAEELCNRSTPKPLVDENSVGISDYIEKWDTPTYLVESFKLDDEYIEIHQSGCVHWAVSYWFKTFDNNNIVTSAKSKLNIIKSLAPEFIGSRIVEALDNTPDDYDESKPIIIIEGYEWLHIELIDVDDGQYLRITNDIAL